MFARIARFEASYQLRRTATHVYFGVLFLYAAAMIARAGGVFGAAFDLVGDGGATHLNSPFVINLLVTLPSYFGIVVVAALMVDAACRDLRHGSHALVYTKPISERSFLAGRFAGALIVLLYVFSAPALAIWLVTSLPLVAPERLGPFQALAYLMPYLVTVVPNLFALGALLFAVGVTWRREAPAYVLAVVLLGGFILARALSGDLAAAHGAALLDPFGYVACSAVMDKVWTPAARNTLPLAFQGWIVENRVLWSGIALGALAALGAFFRFAEPDTRGARRRRARRVAQAVWRPADEAQTGDASSTAMTASIAARPVTAPALRLARFELACVLRSPSFRLMLLGLMVLCAAFVPTVGVHEGTPSYPVTFLVLADLSRSFLPLTLLFILFYAGELVWRERDLRMHEICDATPASTCTRMLSKLMAVAGLIVLLLMVVAGSGLLAQVAHGYYRFQPGIYLAELFGLRLSAYLLLAALAFSVHVLVNQKYVGHFVMAVLYILLPNLPALGASHALLRFASDPGYAYSDFTGYGHFVWPVVVLRLYWSAFAVLLVLAAYLFWPRGSGVSLRERLRSARRRADGRARAAALAAAAAWLALGAFIFHSTLIVNRSPDAREQEAAEYERSYADLADVPQPKIVAIDVAADLYPRRRAFRARAEYTLRNKTDRAIEVLHVCLPRPEVDLLEASADREWRPAAADRRLGYFRYALARPLAPGGEMQVAFSLRFEPRGFRSPESAEGVLANGTFLMNGDWAPHIGYLRGRELAGPMQRVRFSLPPRRELVAEDAPGALGHGAPRDADFLRFAATVSTETDQIALAPGRLVRTWTEGDRRSFAYRMVQPILNRYAIVSARYSQRRARVNGTEIELYSLAGHEHNLDRMERALKAALSYHEESFGPYPFGVVRLAEVPSYAPFAARSCAAGLLLCSETDGFLMRLEREQGPEIDVVSSLIAHEIGHQWWGHQVPGADVQGGPLTQETLAQYSRLMTLKRLQDAQAVRRLLLYAREEYLAGRGGGSRDEQPLVSVGLEPHVFYSKGLLAMNALARYAGEERLNAALAEHVREAGLRAPPYASARRLVDRFRQAMPDPYKPLVGDLFETITFWDLRARRAAMQELDGGRYRVTLTVEASKRRADAAGREVEIPVDDWVEIGVFGAEDRELLLAKKHVASREATFEVELAEKPERAGIDPYHVLIDRDVNDNTRAVELR